MSLRTIRQGTAKKSRSKRKSLKNPARRPAWEGVPEEELEGLAGRIKDVFEWEHEPHQWQVDGTKAQLLRKDVLLHAGTGMGKTTLAAAPHTHEGAKGKTTFMLSPLIALQEEQVQTFENEFKLRVTAINSSRGGLTKERMEEIRTGKWQIVVLSPEMMLSKVFITQVIRHRDMADKILSVVVDEAHVVSHWGSGFRKKYGTLGILRALLPRGTPGDVRILICTDAAGMGCNIPDIDVVVQWKLPASVSSFVQRAGRAARGRGRKGLAVLLIEKSVYDADVLKYLESAWEERGAEGSKKIKSRGVRQATTYPKATKESGYALSRGVLRGGADKGRDSMADGADVPLDEMAIDEGMYSLVQTGSCRRKVLTAIYKNKEPTPSVPCCDNCNPELLDLTRPSPVVTEKRNIGVKRGLPNSDVLLALNKWRVELKRRDFRTSFFSAAGLLCDGLVEDLSSVGPIDDMVCLKLVLGGKWSWVEKYGEELLVELISLKIPPMIPKPTAKQRTSNAQALEKETSSSRVDPVQGPVATASGSGTGNIVEPPSNPTPSTIEGASIIAGGGHVPSSGRKRGRVAQSGEAGQKAKRSRAEASSTASRPSSIGAHNDVNGDRVPVNAALNPHVGVINAHVTPAQGIHPPTVVQPSIPNGNPYMHLSVIGHGMTPPPQHPPQYPRYAPAYYYPGYGYWPPPPSYPIPGGFGQGSGAMSYQQMANVNVNWQQPPAPAPAASTSHHPPQPPPT